MVGMATTFFPDIFCFTLLHLAEDEIRQLLEEKVAQQEKRNCSSFKKVLEREIYSFVTMFIFSAYNV